MAAGKNDPSDDIAHKISLIDGQISAWTDAVFTGKLDEDALLTCPDKIAGTLNVKTDLENCQARLAWAEHKLGKLNASRAALLA